MVSTLVALGYGRDVTSSNPIFVVKLMCELAIRMFFLRQVLIWVVNERHLFLIKLQYYFRVRAYKLYHLLN